MNRKRTGVLAAVTLALVATPITFQLAQASRPGPDISWGSCPKGTESNAVRCGQISVPSDWSRPDDSAKTKVHVARLKASDPEKRVGTLFFNPGGPGENATGYLLNKKAREGYFPAALRVKYDIVAVEPRGTGRNPGLKCPTPVDATVTEFPADQKQAAELVASNRRLGAECVGEAGSVSRHLDTASVARDMDSVREALGEEKVSFLGVSYGTMLAQSYAEAFPERVRRMVLDGVVDRSLSWRQLAETDAAAVEDGIGRFDAWCADSEKCALHGTEIPDFIQSLLRRADSGEIKDGDRGILAEEISQAVNAGLNVPELYPLLATGLKKVEAEGKLEPLASLTRKENPNYSPYRAIICQDVPVPAGAAAQFPAEARRLRALAPTLRGYSEFWDIVSGCAGWPAPSSWKPHHWKVPADFPPTLLLSGAHDVATPPSFAAEVRRHIPGSRLLKWEEDGHTAWNNSPATVAHAVRYLTDGTMPSGSS